MRSATRLTWLEISLKFPRKNVAYHWAVSLSSAVRCRCDLCSSLRTCVSPETLSLSLSLWKLCASIILCIEHMVDKQPRQFLSLLTGSPILAVSCPNFRRRRIRRSISLIRINNPKRLPKVHPAKRRHQKVQRRDRPRASIAPPESANFLQIN